MFSIEFKEGCYILKGPCGSGKTTRAIERYKYLVENNKAKSEEILVLVLNRMQSLKWKNELILTRSGAKDISSYFGFIQDEVVLYWPYILEKCDKIEKRDIRPTFMTFESSQSIMQQIVDKKREEGFLIGITSTSDRIAIELISNILKASISYIPFEDIGNRLFSSLEVKDLIKKQVYDDAQIMIDLYVESLLKEGVLDYGLTVYLYNNYLLKDERYLEKLKKKYKHIIVDNLEESVPCQVDLISLLIENTKSSLLLYREEGGFRVRYGANPKYIEKKIMGKFNEINLENVYTSRHEFIEFGDAVGKKVLDDDLGIEVSKLKDIYINPPYSLRSEMIDNVAKNVLSLLDEGYFPRDIHVICPENDVIMEYSLQKALDERNIRVVNLSRKTRFIDNEFVHALIVLAIICYDFDIVLNDDDIRTTLSLLLGLDIIRSSILTKEVFVNSDEKNVLKSAESEEVKERVGEKHIEKYEYLKDWIDKYKNGELISIDKFFKKVYLEILINLPTSRQNHQVCKQLIDSAETFVEVLSNFKESKNSEEEYVRLIKDGVKEAESIFQLEERLQGEYVAISNPYVYLDSGERSKVQIWTDISSDFWAPSNSRALTNPYALTITWKEGDVYTQEMEDEDRRRVLSSVVKSLFKSASERIYMFDSIYSIDGFQQEGILSEAIYSVKEVQYGV